MGQIPPGSLVEWTQGVTPETVFLGFDPHLETQALIAVLGMHVSLVPSAVFSKELHHENSPPF